MEENDGRASASGKRGRSTKAPSRGTKATRGAAALDGEVSDEMYWTMVKASQRVGAEASTTSFLDDQAVLDDGGMTLETEAFINGLIRFPSMLDLDANNLHRSISASLDHGFVAADDDFDGPRSMRMRSPTPPDIVLAGVDALFAPTSSDSRTPRAPSSARSPTTTCVAQNFKERDTSMHPSIHRAFSSHRASRSIDRSSSRFSRTCVLDRRKRARTSARALGVQTPPLSNRIGLLTHRCID